MDTGYKRILLSRNRLFIFIILIGFMGTLMLLATRAATKNKAVEAEASKNINTVNDQTASSGKYILFNTKPSTNPDNASNAAAEAVRNLNPTFSRFSTIPSSSLDLNALTGVDKPDNGPGPGGEAQFRTRCHYSHLLFDDPFVYPGQPGKSHLHMFFGNTGIDAMTTDQSLINSGGGSCQGYELNRTGYWMPALLDQDNKVRVPTNIDMYYKTRFAQDVIKYPQGLRMLSDKQNSRVIGWMCYTEGAAFTPSPVIPERCASGRLLLSVHFPECWNGTTLDSPDHKSHLYTVDGQESCPPSHPKRLVAYSLQMYWDVGSADLSKWYVSSDTHNGAAKSRGETVHADWWGGWNEELQDIWFTNCIKAVRNCSIGQTGTSRRLLPREAGEQHPNGVGDGNYPGPKILDVGL